MKKRFRYQCLDKVKIKTLREAKVAARRKKGRHWYMCDNCHFYHTGDSIWP